MRIRHNLNADPCGDRRGLVQLTVARHYDSCRSDIVHHVSNRSRGKVGQGVVLLSLASADESYQGQLWIHHGPE